MKLARFWARDRGEAADSSGERVETFARGWSNESVAAAHAKAREIAARVAERILSHSSDKEFYPYGDRPLPEPTIRELSPTAVVTRNAYGALVLNTDAMMFADIDRTGGSESAGAGLGHVMEGIFSLFGKTSAPQQAAGDPVADAVGKVADRHKLTARLYRTAAGYRVLIANASFQAGSAEAEKLLEELGSDPMYVRLCALQESFRARLTPKPWRADFAKPPVTFPFETPDAEAAYAAWVSEYIRRSSRYATCQYLTTLGQTRVAAEFEDIIQFHDRETKATSGLPLA